MKISYKPTGINNFHNCPPINIIVSGEEDDGMYIISARQQKRIEKHFCGMSDCRCAGGACQQLNENGTVWGIYKNWCEK